MTEPTPPPELLPVGSIAQSYYDEEVRLFRTSGLDESNEPEYTEYRLRCRLDRKTTRVQDPSGIQMTCSHVMLCDTEINPATDHIVTAGLEKLIPRGVVQHKGLSVDHYEVFLN